MEEEGSERSWQCEVLGESENLDRQFESGSM